MKRLKARLEAINKEGFECKLDDIQLYLEHYVGKDGKQVVLLKTKGGCNGIWYGFCF